MAYLSVEIDDKKYFMASRLLSRDFFFGRSDAPIVSTLKWILSVGSAFQRSSVPIFVLLGAFQSATSHATQDRDEEASKLLE